ncbi:MAG: sulfur reduction protein DsrE [Actinobacteria bacterium HGW-Actinobacteria-8]|nr:MAG: sulfur reduction protein DsrE [Actinobacteria bacterium HGW-Actinobacteria-8]
MARLVVKCTWGVERPEALVQAFTVAATAAASGVEVSLWLTGDAVLAAGTVTVCTQCIARRDIGSHDLLEGVRIAGAAAFVSESMAPDSTALIY